MGQASGGLRIGDLVGRREGLRADLAADLDVARPRFAGMSAADIRLGGAGTVALADGVLTFVPSASSTIEGAAIDLGAVRRSEEHTSELQSLMRITYSVFCLK